MAASSDHITIVAIYGDTGMPQKFPQTDLNRRCGRCDAAVSRQFVRVFGLGGNVNGCLSCLTRNELAVGKAAVERRENPDVGTTWDGSDA